MSTIAPANVASTIDNVSSHRRLGALFLLILPSTSDQRAPSVSRLMRARSARVATARRSACWLAAAHTRRP
jgi:hypothetical protein